MSNLSPLQRQAKPHREAAEAALARLRAALEAAGIALPSLGLDQQYPFTGTVLIELGAARPDIVEALAAAILRGLAHPHCRLL
jgi:hypothetical protein